MFQAQAAVAVVVGIALLVRPHPLVLTVPVLVAGSAVGAVLLSTHIDVGPLGPLPDMYEPTWAVPGKHASAAAEGLATLLAVIGLVTAVWAGRRARRADAAAGQPAGVPEVGAAGRRRRRPARYAA